MTRHLLALLLLAVFLLVALCAKDAVIEFVQRVLAATYRFVVRECLPIGINRQVLDYGAYNQEER